MNYCYRFIIIAITTITKMEKGDVQQEIDDAVSELKTEIDELREKIETADSANAEPPITRAELTAILHKELFRHAYNADMQRDYDYIRAELMEIKRMVEPKPSSFTNLRDTINNAMISVGHSIRTFEMTESAAIVSLMIWSGCIIAIIAGK